jgi:hypothetical protein
MLGHSTDVNILTWLISQTPHPTTTHKTTNNTPSINLITNTYHRPNRIPPNNPISTHPSPDPPQLITWQPLHSHKDCIYTDGSLKTGKPRLGAAVIQSPTPVTAYIDASVQDETHTIMRAKLAATHVALDKYKYDPLICIFRDSQTSLHAIQHEPQRLSHTNYHRHKPLTTAIVSTLQYNIK